MRTHKLRTASELLQGSRTKHAILSPAFGMLVSADMDNHSATFRPPTFENGQHIRDRAFEFACTVVRFCEALEEGRRVGRLMVPRLLSCSLSFATMLEEARAAESD